MLPWYERLAGRHRRRPVRGPKPCVRERRQCPRKERERQVTTARLLAAQVKIRIESGGQWRATRTARKRAGVDEVGSEVRSVCSTCNRMQDYEEAERASEHRQTKRSLAGREPDGFHHLGQTTPRATRSRVRSQSESATNGRPNPRPPAARRFGAHLHLKRREHRGIHPVRWCHDSVDDPGPAEVASHAAR